MCEPEEKDLYAVLGASPSDSVQQLRHRYQQLALKYHPDRREDVSSEAPAVNKFVEVHSAWKVLGEPNTRRQYDSQRRDEQVYTHSCRCGGGFGLSQEEVEEETRLLQPDEEEEEGAHTKPAGVFVCCDTCSLSICVTWSLKLKDSNA